MTNQLTNNSSLNLLQEDTLPQEDQRPKTHLQLQFITQTNRQPFTEAHQKQYSANVTNNPNQIPSSNIAQDVHHSVNTLYDIQKSIFSSLTPTQTTLFTTYHNLLVSISRYLSQSENIPQPMPAPRIRYSPPPQ